MVVSVKSHIPVRTMHWKLEETGISNVSRQRQQTLFISLLCTRNFFSLSSALLHCSVMCIFPAVEDKLSKFSSKESLQDCSAKERKNYLTTTMREKHTFAEFMDSQLPFS